MKKKIEFPDWTGPACMMITGGGKDGKRPVWCEYTQTESDLLSLRVTVEIAGGFPSIFTRYETPEAKEAARLEEDRRAAWTNALAFAEQLWRGGTHRDFVVMFRPENPNVGPEAVCIFRRIEPTAPTLARSTQEGGNKVSNCRGCGCPIEWIRTRDGSNTPVDPEPVFVIEGGGSDRFMTDEGEVITGRAARPEEESHDLPVAFVPHWKTCPNAGDFRRKR